MYRGSLPSCLGFVPSYIVLKLRESLAEVIFQISEGQLQFLSLGQEELQTTLAGQRGGGKSKC